MSFNLFIVYFSEFDIFQHDLLIQYDMTWKIFD